MKFNITCKFGVYSNPIKITFNNKSKILTYKNSKITFNFDIDTEYELAMLILYTTRIIKVTQNSESLCLYYLVQLLSVAFF